VFAQKAITGNVTDPNGVALAGATIIEKGTSNGEMIVQFFKFLT